MGQKNMDLDTTVERVDEYKFEPIKGYPMLNWKGKRPFRGTKYFPAQLKEVHGDDVNGWLNKIFWGDNIQVMSHLLKEYRGKVDLVYIDPPFDSKADYKKKIKLKGKEVFNDTSLLEEKQYTDMWSNDEYLQFMYERLMLIRELLSDSGSIYIHLDWHKSHLIRSIMDEIFGSDNFVREIIWNRGNPSGGKAGANNWIHVHDNILYYAKIKENRKFNKLYVPYTEEYIAQRFTNDDNDGNGPYRLQGSGSSLRKQYLKDSKGKAYTSVWDIPDINVMALERTDYPTQKPTSLLELIISSSSNIGDIVFDCFMGSGTTMAVAQKLGRKFVGADINLGAIQTSTKRLINIVKENQNNDEMLASCGFEVYNVNNYDVFRNPVQAKELLVEALEIDPLGSNSYFEGMKDGQKVKIMPVNRIATKADVSALIQNLDYKGYEEAIKDNTKAKVDDILLVCMGHDPEIKAHFEKECPYNIGVKVYDILKDGSELIFKRDSEAKIVIDSNHLSIAKFYPNTLLEKLRQDSTEVKDYREMVESIMIDPNYDGSVFEPTIVDIPDKKELVVGEYELPNDRGTVAIKITDLLSETYFEVINNG